MPDGYSAPYEMASPLLLSAQPPTLSNPEQSKEVDPNWDQEYAYFEARLNSMRNWRYGWWQHWAKLAEYILPSQYFWLITANLMSRKGNMINQAIVDSTATWAMEICAAGFVDGVMPTTRPWLKLGASMPGFKADADAKRWFEDTEQRLYTVLAQSNFYTIMAQAAKNLVVFGTAPVIMYEDAEQVLRCYSPVCGEYYLAVGSRFSVDTFYTEETMTVVQIVERFQLQNCPPAIQDLWEESGGALENEYIVARAVEPNFPLAGRGQQRGKQITIVKGGFPYREVYWLRGQATPRALSKRGFHESPFAVARWSVAGNDPYGRSPGMDALGDTMQLQIETRRKAEAIQKQVRPPMGADPELAEQPMSTEPGKITYMDTSNNKKGFWPLFDVHIDLGAMIEDLKEIQARIQKCFLVDVFMAISQMEGVQPRNAVEITERKGEKLQRLGPVIGLWKTEFAEVLIPRAINIMRRRGLLQPLPKSLQMRDGRAMPLKIDYIDMVTLAQRGANTASMERGFQVMGSLSQAAKAAGVADPIRTVNLDKSLGVYLEEVDFPSKCLYSDQEVATHDAMRAKMAQQQQASAATTAAVQAAQGLSNTNVGGGQNALQAILGSQGGPVAAGTA